MSPRTLHPGDIRSAWADPVTSVRLVDDTRAEALGNLGITTVGDLIRHYPFRYLDLRKTPSLAEVKIGEEVTVIGRVHEIRIKRPRPRLQITEVAIVDGTGVLIGVWFNQPYVAKRFVEGEHVAFAGKVEYEYHHKRIKQPYVEKLGAADAPSHLGRILPVHKATEGLSTNWIRRLVLCALDQYGRVPDPLPAPLRIERGLMSRHLALRLIHFPEDVSDIEQARRRLVYEEFFFLQAALALKRHALTTATPGVAHVVDGKRLRAFRNAVPFELTDDQQRAVDEVLDDMSRPVPMSRLLLGDVGTGKTIVAAHAICAAADSGGQAAMMAPTEVLARQYSDAIGPYLDEAGVHWELLTGSSAPDERERIFAGMRDGSIDALVGTHALIDSGVSYKNLTLAIVDEQHRFGVKQRIALRKKGGAADLLVMTATPIPRSLAMTAYGDLAVSTLKKRPPHAERAPTVTRLVDKRHREEAYEAVRRAVSEGRQAYVVCPLVEESEAAEAKAAVKEAERLAKKEFSGMSVGLLHGKMPPADKHAVMEAFARGEIDVLVTTTVVEVGVDVPNATTMIVEGAERFGLAQLHQLRGRVGRGEHPGLVYLFADPKTEEGKARMQAILSTDDGFELAELDLRLRGPGQLLGDRQHGLPDLRIASLAEDGEILAVARQDAKALIEGDPDLQDPLHGLLRQEIEESSSEFTKWVSSG